VLARGPPFPTRQSRFLPNDTLQKEKRLKISAHVHLWMVTSVLCVAVEPLNSGWKIQPRGSGGARSGLKA
jgi:hypothetical protein